MTTELIRNIRDCALRRAHLHGAEWVTYEKQAAALLARAAAARLRYAREMVTVDTLTGHIPSSFDPRA